MYKYITICCKKLPGNLRKKKVQRDEVNYIRANNYKTLAG